MQQYKRNNTNINQILIERILYTIIQSLHQKVQMDNLPFRTFKTVFVIPTNQIIEVTDGGAAVYQIVYQGTIYNALHNYSLPVGEYLQFREYVGAHQLFLCNYRLFKGQFYTLNVYLRQNKFMNPWNKGKGKISSERADFRILARKIRKPSLTIPHQNQDKLSLDLIITDYSEQWGHYNSDAYSPEEDEEVSIVINSFLWDRNGYLFDVFMPTITQTMIL